MGMANSDSELMQNLIPTTFEEEQAAASAVFRARRQQAAIDLADNLTDRERWLIEEAYAQGTVSAQQRVAKVIGSAAETLRAEDVRAAAQGGATLVTRQMTPGWYPDDLIKITGRVAGILAAEKQGP